MPGHSARASWMHGQQQGLGLVGQQFGVGQGAGVTTRTTLRSTGPLAGGHVSHLLGNRHRFAHLDEAAQVVFQAWKGTPAITTGWPADWPRCVRVMSSRREAFGVVPEQFVEVAHAVEQQSGYPAFEARYCCIMGVLQKLQIVPYKSTTCCF